MKKGLRKWLIALAGSAVIGFGSQASAEEMTVAIDHTVPMKLSRPAASVVVGNPFIADVMAQAEDLFFVIGRTTGTTNVVALDASGKMISETTVHVTTTGTKRLSLHRSTFRQTYSCATNCEVAPTPGDAPDYFEGVHKRNEDKVNSAAVGREASQ